jgi:hypothetical protein
MAFMKVMLGGGKMDTVNKLLIVDDDKNISELIKMYPKQYIHCLMM